MHTCIHTSTHACMHYSTCITVLYINTTVQISVHTCIHTYICIPTYIRAYIHTCRHTDIQTYIHTYMHTYIHTWCIHAYCICRLSVSATVLQYYQTVCHPRRPKHSDSCFTSSKSSSKSKQQSRNPATISEIWCLRCWAHHSHPAIQTRLRTVWQP